MYIHFSLFFTVPLATSLLFPSPLVFFSFESFTHPFIPPFLFFSCYLVHLEEGIAKHLVCFFPSFGVSLSSSVFFCTVFHRSKQVRSHPDIVEW